MSSIREDGLIFSHQLLPRAAHRDGARVFLSPRDADKSSERRGIRARARRGEPGESGAAGRITNHFPGPRNPANWLKSRSWPCRNIGNLSPAYTGEDRARENEINKGQGKERERREAIFRSGRLARIFPSLIFPSFYVHLFIFPSRCSLSLPRHFGSPRRCLRRLPIVTPPRQGKQCLISVNAAIMAPSSLHRAAELRRREREISEIRAGHGMHRKRVSNRIYTYMYTHTHTYTQAIATEALDYRLWLSSRIS